ncbi:MAG: calcium/sodium antiporter [Pseudomonadota bacterium]
MMTLLLIIAGFAGLLLGGEILVRGAVSIARRFGMSELVIGLTLVGFGTSLPELVTSLRALQADAVGLSIGNVLGSNIANIMLVLGVAAIITPIITSPRALARDGLFMVAATGLFAVLLWIDAFTRTTGLFMVGLLLTYLVLSIWLDRRRENPVALLHQETGEVFEKRDGLWTAIALTIGGATSIIFGAQFLVQGGTSAARMLGVSETVIGISVLAVGTSLPELVTSFAAARRGKSDVALGNLLGSNIFNILGIIGVSASVIPFSVNASPELTLGGHAASQALTESVVSSTDMQALGLSVVLLALFAYTGRRIARWEGLVLLGGYALYLGLRFGLVPVPGA